LAKDNLGLNEGESPAHHHTSHPTPKVREQRHHPAAGDFDSPRRPGDLGVQLNTRHDHKSDEQQGSGSKE
jgi:hypothetical protein